MTADAASVPFNSSINSGSNAVLQAAAMGFNIDVSDPNTLLTGNQAALIEKDMAAAAKEWMDRIDNPHQAPINILINITNDDSVTPRMSGRPAFYVSTGTGDGATLEPAVEHKLLTGSDLSNGSADKLAGGAQADVVVYINSKFLNSAVWLDANPSAGSDVPPTKVDMIAELAHEFGHGLGIGMTESLDPKTAKFNTSVEKTTWESHLDIEKSGTTFTGSHAEQQNGGHPVVVTTDNSDENYGHLGNSLADSPDHYSNNGPDLMYGVAFYEGQNYEVSDQDVAILQDLGYSTKARTAVPGYYVASTHDMAADSFKVHLGHDIAADSFRLHTPTVGHDIAAASFGHHKDDTSAATTTHHVLNGFNGDGINDVLHGNKLSDLSSSQSHVNDVVPSPMVGSIAINANVDLVKSSATASAINLIGAGDHNHTGKADVVLQHAGENVAPGKDIAVADAGKVLDVAKGGGDHGATHAPNASLVTDAAANLVSHTDTSVIDPNHQVHATVSNALHGISFSELPAHLLDSVNKDAGSHSGGHDTTPDSHTASVTHQPLSIVDHVPAHFELPPIPHNEFVHVH